MALLTDMRRVVMRHGLGHFGRYIRPRLGLEGAPSPAAVSAVLADPSYAHLVATRTVMEINRLEYYERLGDAMGRMLVLLEAELTARGAT